METRTPCGALLIRVPARDSAVHSALPLCSALLPAINLQIVRKVLLSISPLDCCCIVTAADTRQIQKGAALHAAAVWTARGVSAPLSAWNSSFRFAEAPASSPCIWFLITGSRGCSAELGKRVRISRLLFTGCEVSSVKKKTEGFAAR